MSALSAGSATLARVATSTTVATLLAASGTRRMAVIYNDAAGALYVKFGATATSTDFTVKIAGGGYFELPSPMYTGAITGILDTGTGNAQVTSY